MNPSTTLTYSIVIATRNRSEALKLSLPRMLAQTRPPQQIIIVDSSDDLSASRIVTRDILGATAIDWRLESSERGTTKQRNLGLNYSEHPVTMLPDDDAIWFPSTAEEMMAVYERDTSQQVSAVCAAESFIPPIDFHTSQRVGYSMRSTDRLRLRSIRLRRWFENRFFPDPGRIVGQSFISSFSKPGWFAEHGVVPVDYMTGFRMSFRTAVLRKTGFDLHFTNYAIFDDIDASFGAWKSGAVVAATKAKVYHHRSPERRLGGWRIGARQLLDKAYVVAKHTPIGSSGRACMRRFALYKVVGYLLSWHSSHGRSRFLGAKAALRELPSILRAQPDTVAAAYTEAVSRCAA